MALLEQDTFSGDIGAAASETLTVSTNRADHVVIFIDDGTQDGAPAQYDLVQRARSGQLGRFQFYDEITASTRRSWMDPAVGTDMEIELTNTSGGAATYNVTAESRRRGR